MYLLRESFLLFCLNLLDALLTIIWVRNGAAEEANSLMAKLLDMGDSTFLAAKLAIGTFAAAAFLLGRHTKLARYGISLAIAVYLGLACIHVATGFAAFELASIVPSESVTQICVILASAVIS